MKVSLTKKRGPRGHTQGGGYVKMGAETEVMWPQAKRCQEYQKLEEARKYPPLEPSEGAWPADTWIPALVVLCPIAGNLSWQPLETNAQPYFVTHCPIHTLADSWQVASTHFFQARACQVLV